eukprot:CAMPEP_0115238590 /NCGR_PEP_ID=MMETSP0270-20121206/36960_1 /TAXON_ID=71861 /ORGANISM="Scrippsiella trochoidea, Strain CCMP3099" /LENGTH=69 /DNA_ID=CAMNT_0002653519 /DNA_START=310 /DNA_END=519 /DNA_ORIENTATION=-
MHAITTTADCTSELQLHLPEPFSQTTVPDMLLLSSSSRFEELSSRSSAGFAAACLDACGAGRETRKYVR